MVKRRVQDNMRLTRQTAELALAAPQVVAQRLARMAAAKTPLSARDRSEFQRMGTEKVAAWMEACSAMSFELWRGQQQWAQSWLQSLWMPWLKPKHGVQQQTDAALAVLGKGLAPLHRRAVANAKRLGKAKRKRGRT